MGFAESSAEKSIYQYLSEQSDSFAGMEKPMRDSVFLTEDGDRIQCDLMWKNAKLLFFSEYGDDDYAVAAESDWQCISVREGKSVLDSLIKGLNGG